MSDNFEQNSLTSFEGIPLYNWSDPNNWSNGIPPNGGTVVVNLPYTSNPASNDDLATVTYLDLLTDEDGEVAVDHTLTVADLNVTSLSSAVDAGADRGIYATSLETHAPTLLVIDSITGSGGNIGAGGTGAVTEVLASSDPGETYAPSDGGEVILDAAPDADSTFSFYDGPGTLALEHPGSAVAALLFYTGVGDVLELPGTEVSAVIFGAGNLTITTNLGTTTFSDVNYEAGSLHPSGYVANVDPGTGLEAITFIGAEAACYVTGTRIATAVGEVKVEDLAIGDLVETLYAGLQKIKWIGQRSYDGRFIAGNKDVLPICIKRHAIAENVPARELFVSPGHAICIDGALIHAIRLVNGVSITQADSVESVTYYHIELETHEIIFAENCPAETFMGEHFRKQFQNAWQFARLYPGEAATETMCLPRLESGFQLHAIQQRIAARAGITRPAAPEPGPLRGYVDQAGPKICCGWVQDISASEEPVCLDITVDGRTIGRVLANLYRADLRAAGYGSGYHGFEFLLPPGISGRVDAVRTADRAVLEWTESAAAHAA